MPEIPPLYHDWLRSLNWEKSQLFNQKKRKGVWRTFAALHNNIFFFLVKISFILAVQNERQPRNTATIRPENIKVAYWINSNIAIAILNFSLLLPFSYRSSNFAIAKLSLLISLLHFLYKFCRLVHGFFSVLLPI